MRKDKDIAFSLRKQGKTYREIQKELGVSKSTLCEWFRDVSWSNHIKYKNNLENKRLSKERLELLNAGRKKKLDDIYKKVVYEAEKEYENFKNEPLFMAGLMIYAGEGTKIGENQVKMTNSEIYLHRIFIRFCERYLQVSRNEVKFCLIVYPDHIVPMLEKFWLDALRIPRQNLYKTQIIKGREKTKKLQNGVGMSIILNNSKKKKLLKWLELCRIENEYFFAAIV